MTRDALSAALLLAATLLGGCDGAGPSSGFTTGTVAFTSIEVTPTESGGAQIDAVLSLELQAFEEPDEVALDSVSFAIGGGDVVIVDVGVDDDDWPARLVPGAVVVRELRVAAQVARLPEGTTGLCPGPLGVAVNVGLLVGTGRSEAIGSAEVSLDAGGPRLGLARQGGEVPAPFDSYSPSVDATVDGEGTTWMMVREVYGAAPVGTVTPAAQLLSRRSTGEVTQRELASPTATMAPVADGGVVVVEVKPGRAVISRLNGTGEALWTRQLRSRLLTLERGVPVTAGANGVTLALPGHAEVSMDGLPEAPPAGGSFLVDVDLDGTPTSITPVPEVHALASAGDLLVLATPMELVALRDRQEAWRIPFFATALTITAGEDIVAADHGFVVRLRGEDGAHVWSAYLTRATPATSIAMRANGEVLVGSTYGTAARIGAEGAVLFDAEVVCGGVEVRFGGSAGRVGYGVAFHWFEGWGDTPDREITSPTLALGEVLP